MTNMPNVDPPQNEKFLVELLNLYSESTGLSIAFYDDNDNGQHLYSNKNWPKFCQEICRIVEPKEIYDMEYPKNKKNFYACYPGLWCQALPIKLDDGHKVGAFVAGYRRIKGREKESKMALERFLVERKVNNKDSERLRRLLEEVDAVDENAFDIKLLEKLSHIENLVIMERQRVITEKEHTIAFKQEAVSLAHEFLLPIQSITATAENLFDEAEDGSELKNLAEDILQQATKLYFIAENIRGSVLEESENKFEYEFREMDIYPIIRDTIELFQKEAKRKNVVISDPVVIGDIPVPSIEASEPHITRVFFNLIHNAVKYSYAGSERSERFILVVCKPYKNFYCVEITNYGVGIAAEEISKGLIFEERYRGKLARDRSRTGSGVGLSTVKRIIEMHNGYIEVHSMPINSDLIIGPYKTTVKVCLPFRQPLRSSHGNKKDIIGRR